MIQDFILIKKSSQSNDHIFTCNPWSKLSCQLYLGDWRDLPPGSARGPDCGSIGTHHRSPQHTQTTIHIGMTVRCDHHFARPGIPFFTHDLMTNSTPGRIEINIHFCGKILNLSIFIEVGFTGILDIVVQGKNGLSGVDNTGSTHTLKFLQDGSGIVMSQYVERQNRKIIATLYTMSLLQINSCLLSYFFNQVL